MTFATQIKHARYRKTPQADLSTPWLQQNLAVYTAQAAEAGSPPRKINVSEKWRSCLAHTREQTESLDVQRSE